MTEPLRSAQPLCHKGIQGEQSQCAGLSLHVLLSFFFSLKARSGLTHDAIRTMHSAHICRGLGVGIISIDLQLSISSSKAENISNLRR